MIVHAEQENSVLYLSGIDCSPPTFSTFYRTLVSKISKVGVDDLRRVGERYVGPVFDNARSKVAVCCHPTKVEDIVAGFKE